MEIILYSACIVLSIVGIYLNLAYQRATHRSTVYARFTGRNLRFLSLAQIALAFSNVVFTAAMWGSRANRSKKSENFFSMTLSLTRALPAVTIFWVTVERIMFNRLEIIRDTQKFRYIAIFRVVQVLASVLVEFLIRASFASSHSATSLQNFTAPSPEELETTDNPEEDGYVKSSLIANYYYDFYHGALIIFSFAVVAVIYHLSNGSYTRAGLLGGMRNDQKIQTLRAQLTFFKRSWLPMFAACLSDFVLQLVIKRILVLDEMTHDIVYLTSRCYLPIVYPISLIAFHRSLRIDYFANFILCRKARNLHKESKVKVIATRESQESIIANLKMIGILSDVDTNAAGAAAAMMGGMNMGGVAGLGGARPVSALPGRVAIAKDPMSNSSMGSSMGHKASSVSLGGGGSMMFHTRPKSSVPSMGSVG